MKKTKKKILTYAAIDIGSNAVRLLIKQIDEKSANKFSKLCMLRVPLRLGFDVFATSKISPEKERKMLRLMKAYRLLMKVYEVDDYRACATSAMRDASNGKEIIAKIEKSTGIKIATGRKKPGSFTTTISSTWATAMATTCMWTWEGAAPKSTSFPAASSFSRILTISVRSGC